MNMLLDRQIDEDGLHRSRSAKVQFLLIVELTTLRQSLLRQSDAYRNELGDLLESMHRALDAISLGTGEPAYFNGTGQMPHDIIVAVQSQTPTRARSTGTAGGYGRLIWGKSIVVADSGLVPPPEYARHMHAVGAGLRVQPWPRSRGVQLRAGAIGRGGERAALPPGHRAFRPDHQRAVGRGDPDARAAQEPRRARSARRPRLRARRPTTAS